MGREEQETRRGTHRCHGRVRVVRRGGAWVVDGERHRRAEGRPRRGRRHEVLKNRSKETLVRSRRRSRSRSRSQHLFHSPRSQGAREEPYLRRPVGVPRGGVVGLERGGPLGVRLRRRRGGGGDHGGGGRLRRLGLLVGGRRHGGPRGARAEIWRLRPSPPQSPEARSQRWRSVWVRWDACASPAVSLPGGGAWKQSLRRVGRGGRSKKAPASL